MKRLPWWAIHLADLLVMAAFAVVLIEQDAPAWAITLLIYLATKPSRVAHAADMGAIQTTIRVETRKQQEEEA